MATTPTAAPATQTMTQKIGLYVEIAGAGAFVTGGILSVHHYAIGVCFLAGAAAIYIGQKFRAA